MIRPKTMEKRLFAERAINDRVSAFAFDPRGCWFEFHPEFSSRGKYPDFELKEDSTFDAMQGTFNCINDETIADLWLVLSDLEERGVEFYTFWRELREGIKGETETWNRTEWVVWTPEEELQ